MHALKIVEGIDAEAPVHWQEYRRLIPPPMSMELFHVSTKDAIDLVEPK